MAFRSKARTPEGVLRAAARLIRERGWHQGGGVQEDGARCLWLAVARVVRGEVMDRPYPTNGYTEAYVKKELEAYSEENNQLIRDVETILCQRLHVEGVAGVWLWNDARGRTVEQVLALLEGQPIPA